MITGGPTDDPPRKKSRKPKTPQQFDNDIKDMKSADSSDKYLGEEFPARKVQPMEWSHYVPCGMLGLSREPFGGLDLRYTL